MENTNQSPKIKLDFKDSKYATGRRKTSIAKVWLKKGTGKIYVNGKTLDDYFTSSSHKMQIMRPFDIINQSTEYDVKSKVVGGGHTGQAGALVHGISRALLQFDENLKPTLRKEKLTTRDSRSVERKKPGRAKARRSCGSTGYIGIELVKILSRHKKIHIKYLCGNSSVGKNISFYDKSLSKKKLPIIRKFQRKLLKEVDVIFSALPNGEAQKLSKFLLDKNLLIDLSADFRLKNKNEYLKWYKIKHSAQKLIKNSIYSLPELKKNQFKNQKVISSPGCYPTSILLPLAPLIQKNFISNRNIVIDSKSGYSGAGRNVHKKYKNKNLYLKRNYQS